MKKDEQASGLRAAALWLTVALLCFGLGVFFGAELRRRGEPAVVVYAAAATLPPTPAEPELPLVDINTAPAEELTALPGIGPALAESIVAYREAHGGFRYADELMNVSGIGERKYEALRSQVVLSGTERNTSP